MKKIDFRIVACICLVAIIFFACKKDSDGGSTDQPGDDEFKKSMLVNYADNIILPAYTEFQTNLLKLETSTEAFLTSPSQTTVDAVKIDFKAVYLSYEKISVTNFGPANSPYILLNYKTNSFPADKNKIESGITTGTYNFALSPSSDSLQGLPALDYLLFSTDAVQEFSDANAANRKKYVRDIFTNIKSLLSNTISEWNSTYRTAFTTSLKTNSGSSISYLVNQFAYEMDALKGPRIGWPFGKQSNGIVFADKCEGYFSGISGALAVANLTSLKNYYTGAAGKGIDDYLVLLKKETLNNDVLAQFEVALTALKAIPEPMSEAFTANAALVEAAYKEVQKLLTLIKTDVASATAVQITYMDNDGD